jgi:hypothetical protein
MTGLLSLLALSGALIACAPHAQSGGQTPGPDRATPTSDSAIYAAFLETIPRDPRDTLYVDELSAVFQGMSPHYDSIAPGLGAALVNASSPPRPSAALHLPPPIRVVTAAAPQALRDRAILGPSGGPARTGQGTRGIWRFSPVAYSADGREALFYYSVFCGVTCGESTLVWARKDDAGRWEIRRTAILVISRNGTGRILTAAERA